MLSREIQVDFRANCFPGGFFHYLFISTSAVHNNAWVQLCTIPDDFVNVRLGLASSFCWSWVFAISRGGNGVFSFFPLPDPWCAWFVTHAEPSNHFCVCLSRFILFQHPSLYFLPTQVEMFLPPVMFAVTV